MREELNLKYQYLTGLLSNQYNMSIQYTIVQYITGKIKIESVK